MGLPTSYQTHHKIHITNTTKHIIKYITTITNNITNTTNIKNIKHIIKITCINVYIQCYQRGLYHSYLSQKCKINVDDIKLSIITSTKHHKKHHKISYISHTLAQNTPCKCRINRCGSPPKKVSGCGTRNLNRLLKKLCTGLSSLRNLVPIYDINVEHYINVVVILIILHKTMNLFIRPHNI